MSLFLDILLVAVFAFTVINNYRYGFVCSVFRIARLFICLGLAYIFASGVIQYIAVFLVSFIAIGFLIRVLRRIRIPIITQVDKMLGIALGLLLGFFYVSVISALTYGSLELLSAVGIDHTSLYNDSTVFKFIHGINVFDFIMQL